MLSVPHPVDCFVLSVYFFLSFAPSLVRLFIFTSSLFSISTSPDPHFISRSTCSAPESAAPRIKWRWNHLLRHRSFPLRFTSGVHLQPFVAELQRQWLPAGVRRGPRQMSPLSFMFSDDSVGARRVTVAVGAAGRGRPDASWTVFCLRQDRV